MNYALFDIHAHLHDKTYSEDRDGLIKEMKDYGLGAITVGTDIQESEQAISLAEKHTNIFATVGQHPADNPQERFDKNEYLKLSAHKKVVAIGECGLDYHYIDTFFMKMTDKERQEKNIMWDRDAEVGRQKNIFKEQIELACEINKPLMLHGRPRKGSMDAYEDMLALLESAKKVHGTKLRGNAHFFVGDIDIAKRFVDIGFTMSFSGVITFTNDYDDVVRYLPLTMIQAETDSPYATPTPYRGKRNSPMYVQEVVAKIAVLRRQPFEEVRVQLLENAMRMFEGIVWGK